MTILPQKPRSQKDKPPIPGSSQISQDAIVDASAAVNENLNRPSTSRISQPSATTSSSTPVFAEVVDRRLSKSLKRASGTPPPLQQSQATAPRRAKKEHRSWQYQENTREACNSEDEYLDPAEEMTAAALIEREIQFERLMKEKGFLLRRMAEDGGCLFRAVADQVYGDQRWHDVVRRQCIDHMEKNRDYYSAFVTEEFDSYLNRKRRLDCYGNNIEIQAMSELYNRPIQIFRYSTEPINIFQTSESGDKNYPIRLSYHNRSHYNSLASPYEATVGVGLGLPGYQPGMADRALLRDAVLMSEQGEIEKAMLEDKLRETDWEKTQEALEKQVARQSYVQWLREQENRLAGEKETSLPSLNTDIPSTSQEDRACSSYTDLSCEKLSEEKKTEELSPLSESKTTSNSQSTQPCS